MLSTNIEIGAVLSAVAGGLTGAIDLRWREHGSMVLAVLGGAFVATLAYGAFLIAGLIIGVMTFSTTPDPWPALIAVVIGCAMFLGARALQAAFGEHFGMPPRRSPAQPRSFDDLLDARPRGNAPTRWLGGVVMAALPMLYGMQCIVTRRGQLGTSLWPNRVEGGAAIALGVGWIGIGLFLHFHFFFGLHSNLQGYSRRGKFIAMMIAGAGLCIAGVWSVIARVP